MKRFFALFTAVGITLTAGAQTDPKAEQVLDNAAQAYNRAPGVEVQFEGTQQGSLFMKKDCFFLDCGDVKSWFDGTTQWSYVASNEEVTVSNPTPEELQATNPYAIISSYKTMYRCRYEGLQAYKGKQVHCIVLTPTDPDSQVQAVTLRLSTDYRPVSVRVDAEGGDTQTFDVVRYRKADNLSPSTFRFDVKQYPGTEVIDMR